jgi:hypothetical protein
MALTQYRETLKKLLNFPADTNIQWKSHDDSISQRTDQGRYENKRRGTVNTDDLSSKDKTIAA